MANSCYTTYNFQVAEKHTSELRKFYNRLNEIVYSSKCTAGAFANIANHFGLQLPENYYGGSVIYMSTDNQDNREYCSVEVSCEDRWVPHPALFWNILERFYPNIEMSYIAEEPGSGVYVKYGDSYLEEYTCELCIPKGFEYYKNIGCYEDVTREDFYSDKELYSLIHIILGEETKVYSDESYEYLQERINAYNQDMDKSGVDYTPAKFTINKYITEDKSYRCHRAVWQKQAPTQHKIHLSSRERLRAKRKSRRNNSART